MSKDYTHKGFKAISWKIFYSLWVPSENPGKWNTENRTLESSSPENCIALSQQMWTQEKWDSSKSENLSEKIRHIQALAVFPDGTEFVLWRSI
jgi:hypothetical protein